MYMHAAAQQVLALHSAIRKRRSKVAKQPTPTACCGKLRCRCYRLGDPKDSEWWTFLQHPETWDTRSKRGKLFRRRFRVPRALLEKLVNLWRERGWSEFKRGGRDACGR